MRKLGLAIVIAGTLGAIAGATAQTYPARPITMIVPFAAGGPNDTIGRISADASVRARLADIGQVIFPRDRQTPRPLPPFTRPISRNGGRSSRRPTSRANDFRFLRSRIASVSSRLRPQRASSTRYGGRRAGTTPISDGRELGTVFQLRVPGRAAAFRGCVQHVPERDEVGAPRGSWPGSAESPVISPDQKWRIVPSRR
jgi:hypothetical protein